MSPERLARAPEGVDPADRAVRSHRNQASEPVTKRFGPRLSPTRSAYGRGGTRAANSDAAGRLLTTTLAPAAMIAVSPALACANRRAGADQLRPTVPRASATANSPTRTARPRTSNGRPGRELRRSRRLAAATMPTTATGSDGDRRTKTSTVTATT